MNSDSEDVESNDEQPLEPRAMPEQKQPSSDPEESDTQPEDEDDLNEDNDGLQGLNASQIESTLQQEVRSH